MKPEMPGASDPKSSVGRERVDVPGAPSACRLSPPCMLRVSGKAREQQRARPREAIGRAGG